MSPAATRTWRALAGSAVLALSAISCTSVQYAADRLDEHIGRSTREDVAAFFGPPQEAREREGGGERWVYRYSQTTIGGAAAVGRRTCWENVLTFDEQGILRDQQRRAC